ncbi:MAG: alpha/beta fold hydrolase [Cyanobacteria bacterium J06639_1]
MSAVKFWLGSAVLVAALGYVALLTLLYVAQTQLVFRPSTEIATTPEDINLDYEAVTLTTSDDVSISAWFVDAPAGDRASDRVLLFCHGNAGNISSRLDYLAIFHSLGLATLAFDYRGFGSSEGQPSEAGTYRDADAAWDYLTGARGIAPEQIVVYGESLGGGVASYVAEQYAPGGLVMASTFTSIGDRAREIYPYIPVELILKTKYQSRDRLPNVSAPVLVIHSQQDEVIPFSHGLNLYEVANEPKEFLEITGLHNSGYMTSLETYRDGLRSFSETLNTPQPQT